MTSDTESFNCTADWRSEKSRQASILVPSYKHRWCWSKPCAPTSSWVLQRVPQVLRFVKTVFPQSWQNKQKSLDGQTDVPHLFISASTSLRIFSSSLEVSYSFSMSYSRQGSAHFWTNSICSGFMHRSKRIPWMLNLGRSQCLDHGFGRIFTFNWWIHTFLFFNQLTF